MHCTSLDSASLNIQCCFKDSKASQQKLRILLGRFLHPFPAPSHFQPHGPRGPPSPPTVLGHAPAPVPTTWQWYPSAKRVRDRPGALLRWIRHKDPGMGCCGYYDCEILLEFQRKTPSMDGYMSFKCLLKSFCNTSPKIQIVPET